MDKDPPDLIIIRRYATRVADQPKTGVWKIAHADFMTAMMALFLVLWLVNSTNRETRMTVAQYFNPIKLTDATSDRKGVRNPQDAEPGESERAELLPGDEKGAKSSGSERRPSNPAKDPRQGAPGFEDPYAVLAEVAAAKPERNTDKAMPQSLGMAGTLGMGGGEVIRDPFDPNFWRQPATARAELQARQAAEAASAAVVNAAANSPAPSQPTQPAFASPPKAPESAHVAASAREAGGEPQPAAVRTAGLSMTPRAPGGADSVATGRPGAAKSQSGSAVANAIAAAIGGGQNDGQRRDAPQIDVRQTDEGVLISLTDNVNFGMFAIGSAEAHPDTVETMKRVASVLKKREGVIVIRGHTDARRFRDPLKDNWRLSTARAHAAQDLLVRGGIDEARIEHVEGHSSRTPRVADPNAAENRRIEILLREKRP